MYSLYVRMCVHVAGDKFNLYTIVEQQVYSRTRKPNDKGKEMYTCIIYMYVHILMYSMYFVYLIMYVSFYVCTCCRAKFN